jgi:hypothetical protein
VRPRKRIGNAVLLRNANKRVQLTFSFKTQGVAVAGRVTESAVCLAVVSVGTAHGSAQQKQQGRKNKVSHEKRL